MTPASLDFSRTLAAAQRGDRDAWSALYHGHASPVLGYLRSQRAPSPEDLLGEVWLQAVRDLQRFSGDESGFRSWLLTIAHHRLLDARRAAARRPAEVGSPELVEEAAGAAEASATSRLEAEQQLLRMLDGIPERQRSVLYMRFVLDMSQREVASALGISTPAIKMLQSRATRSLQKRLELLRDEDEDIARYLPALPGAQGDA
jgi:RNA polymerase sigma-70 factor (ECF subfamily)